MGSFIYMLLTPALCSNWIFGSKYRAKLRRKYNLVEAPYEDVISHIFCPCCSLSQEYRELKIRGLDPALGIFLLLLLLFCTSATTQQHDKKICKTAVFKTFHHISVDECLI